MLALPLLDDADSGMDDGIAVPAEPDADVSDGVGNESVVLGEATAQNMFESDSAEVSEEGQ